MGVAERDLDAIEVLDDDDFESIELDPMPGRSTSRDEELGEGSENYEESDDNKKIVPSEPRLNPEAVRKLKRLQTIFKYGCFVSFVIVIVALVVMFTSDSFKNFLDSSDNLVDKYVERPYNDTDGMGDPITETNEVTIQWEEITIPVPTRKPPAGSVTPSDTLRDGNFTYTFFKHPWQLEAARNICRRHNAKMLHVHSEQEMRTVRDWIIVNVTDKFPFSRAGYYWTGGISGRRRFPGDANYTWFWRDVTERPVYTNFCPNYTLDFTRDYWFNRSDDWRPNFVLDFKPHRDKPPGCWRLMAPDVDEETDLDEFKNRPEHKESLGFPLLCKQIHY